MIKIDTKTIRTSSLSKNITCVIYLKFETFCFPDNNWNDFTVIILNWWSESLKRLLLNESIQESLDFMDGSFSIKIKYLREKLLTFYFIENSEVTNEIKDVLLIDFISSFMKEVNSLIRNLDNLNYNNDELDKLKQNYKTLQKIIKSNRSLTA